MKWRQIAGKGSRFLPAMLIYLLLTLALTYPLPLKMFSTLAGFEARDNFQWVWFLWWSKKAWVDVGTSPANLTFLYHPVGAYHPQLAMEAYTALFGLPFTLSFGPLFAYNIQILLSFFLSGAAMYLLGYCMTGDKKAAFIGGLIFAFYPSKTGHAEAGQFAQVMVYFYPLYAISLWLLLARPGLKRGVLCGSFLGLSLLLSLIHAAYFVIPFTLLFLLYSFVASRQELVSPHLWRGFALALIVAIVLSLPFLGPFLMDYLGGRLNYLSWEGGTIWYSLDLLTFFFPSPYHPLLQGLPAFRELISKITPRLSEHEGYLGFIAIFLAGYALFRSRRPGKWFWLLLSLGAALFSLGPFLKVYGELARYSMEGVESHIVLPYALVKELPLYKWGRTPGRLNDLTLFGLAALACLGGERILKSFKGRGTRLAILTGLAGLLLLEYIAIFPFPTGGQKIPAFYADIAGEREDYAILDLPLESRDTRGVRNRALYYQMFHNHKIVNAYVYRYPFGAWKLIEFLSALAYPLPAKDIVDLPPGLERLRALRALGIKYAVVHKDRMLTAKAYDSLHSSLGQPFYEDEQIAAFALPEARDMEVKELALLNEGDNWYSLEVIDGKPTRWMSNDALAWFYEAEPSRKRLIFTTLAWGQPKLEVFINEQLVEKYWISGKQTLVTPPVNLQRGVNKVRFYFPDRCLPPPKKRGAMAEEATEPCINAWFQEIRFLPAEAKEVQHPFEINLGGEITFLGYDLRPKKLKPGEEMVLILYWRAEKQVENNYVVFIHVVDGEGRKVSQGDGPPLEGVYPTSWWQLGEVVGDRHAFTIPSDLQAGEYELKIGLYRLDTMERLAVAGDATGEAAISLGTVMVESGD
ncbi:MAG: hypothetical protein ACUVV0_13015 [Anaerolineae bacterium]